MNKKAIVAVASLLGLVAITLIIVVWVFRPDKTNDNPAAENETSPSSQITDEELGELPENTDDPNTISGYGKIIIRNLDVDDNTIEIRDAALKIVNEDTEEEYLVRSFGESYIEYDLPYGNYLIEEETPAEGYAPREEKIAFTVSDITDGGEVPIYSKKLDPNAEIPTEEVPTEEVAAENLPVSDIPVDTAANNEIAEKTSVPVEQAPNAENNSTIDNASKAKNPQTSDNNLPNLLMFSLIGLIIYFILLGTYFKIKNKRFY